MACATPQQLSIGRDADDVPRLHRRVYGELLPALAARAGRPAAEQHLLRFKVLGGLGPAATADFLQELVAATPAAGDRQQLRLDVSVDPLMGRVGDDDALPATQHALHRLLAGTPGRTAFCLPCNSAHWRVPHLHFDRSRVDFVSMIDATVDAVHAQLPPGVRVGLLATGQMAASDLYPRAFAQAGYTTVVPDPALQPLLDVAIYGGTVLGRHHAGVKGGDTGESATALVQQVVDALCTQHAVQAICLSCTELPLVFGPQRAGPMRGDARGALVINSTRALARSFLRHALRLQAQALEAALQTVS